MIPLVRLFTRSSIPSSGFIFPQDPSHPADLLNLNLLEDTNYDTHHYALFSNLLLPSLPWMK